MESRKIKSSTYTEMKNDLCLELQQLTIDSGNLGNDLHSANEDFDSFFRCMSERQREFLTRSLLLQEKFGACISLIEGGKQEEVGEGSGENVLLPTAYAEDCMKFVNDVKTSLNAHEKLMTEQYEEMEKKLEQNAKILNENLQELKEKAELISKHKSKLSKKLFDFNRAMVIN